MSNLSLTESEVQLALGVKAEVPWHPFFKFLSSEITIPKNTALVATIGDDGWDMCYQGFIVRSVTAYSSLLACPLSWWTEAVTNEIRIANISKSSRRFVSLVAYIAYMVKQKQDTRLNHPPTKSHERNPQLIALLGKLRPATTEEKNQETQANSTATTMPSTPIRFGTTLIYSNPDKPRDTIYLYFSSPPPLALFLQDLRKRHELHAGDKITKLRVETSLSNIRVMINEEQEDWDWEAALENVIGSNCRANVVFGVRWSERGM